MKVAALAPQFVVESQNDTDSVSASHVAERLKIVKQSRPEAAKEEAASGAADDSDGSLETASDKNKALDEDAKAAVLRLAEFLRDQKQEAEGGSQKKLPRSLPEKGRDRRLARKPLTLPDDQASQKAATSYRLSQLQLEMLKQHKGQLIDLFV